uniref:Cytochrome c oxidase subunit 3 n=1 Tax=Euretidae gen. sp. DVL-2014 TaxID=1569957 RepID=A0A0N7AFR4_9METZ|nr:cytochrome c oxidase subunit 3 [Euretidae gen. sp. DVL-2014]
MNKYHPYHLVEPSPWPIIGGFGALFLTTGSMIYFHFTHNKLIILGMITTTIIMIIWWRDIIREASFQGLHTKKVQKNLKYGMILFILSEILFFFSFFWAFFHSSLTPTIETGVAWPPEGINPLNPIAIPLLNTIILLSSGVTITWSHHSIITSKKKESIISLTWTIILGIIFTSLQIFEYNDSPFTIADSIYGSTFFVATGFHGLHVLIGTTFLIICLIRLTSNHFTNTHHIGFETSSWYWHFVDVVWLFLYLCIYWWGC